MPESYWENNSGWSWGEPPSRDDPLPKRPSSDESSPTDQPQQKQKDKKEKGKKEKKGKGKKNKKADDDEDEDPDPNHDPIKGGANDDDEEDDDDGGFGLAGLESLLNPSGAGGPAAPSKRPAAAAKKAAMKKPAKLKVALIYYNNFKWPFDFTKLFKIVMQFLESWFRIELKWF